MSEPREKKKKSIISGIYDAFMGNESALRRYLGRFVYRTEDIDDMVQETFLRAYHATKTRELDFPKAYLFRVAKSVAVRELNRKSNQVTDFLEESKLAEPQSESSLEEELEAEQKVKLYCEAIAELPRQCRRVFLMRKYQAMSHKEIAQTLGISIGAVEKQITLGIKRCFIYVEKKENGNVPGRQTTAVQRREKWL